MNAHHGLLPARSAMRQFGVNALGAVAVVCAAMVLLPAASKAGGPPEGTFATGGDDAGSRESRTAPFPCHRGRAKPHHGEEHFDPAIARQNRIEVVE
jgi:hypothetical protein